MRAIDVSKLKVIALAVLMRATGKVPDDHMETTFAAAWDHAKERGEREGDVVEAATWRQEGINGMQFGFAYPTYLQKGEMFYVMIGDEVVAVDKKYLYPVPGPTDSKTMRAEVEKMKKEVGL